MLSSFDLNCHNYPQCAILNIVFIDRMHVQPAQEMHDEHYIHPFRLLTGSLVALVVLDSFCNSVCNEDENLTVIMSDTGGSLFIFI